MLDDVLPAAKPSGGSAAISAYGSAQELVAVVEVSQSSLSLVVRPRGEPLAFGFVVRSVTFPKAADSGTLRTSVAD